MANAGKDISFGVRLDKTGFTTGLNQCENEIKSTAGKITSGFGKGIGGALKAGAGWGKQIAGALINPVSGALAGAAIGTAIVSNIKSSFDAAAEDLDVSKKLNSQLSQIGRGDAQKGLEEYAAKFVSAFNIDDTDVKAGMTKLLQAGLSPEQTKGISALAADISKATGDSFDTVSEKLAKAANGDTRALKEYGVFLKSTGDKAKDANLAFGELKKKFGGQGAKIAATENPMIGLSVAFGEFQETFGRVIMPYIVDVLHNITDFFNALASSERFEKTIKGFAEFFKLTYDYLSVILKAILDGKWAELIYNGLLVVLKNLLSFGKLALFGILNALGRFLIKILLQSLAFVIGAAKKILPATLSKYLGIDKATEKLKAFADNFQVIDDNVKKSFSEFGDSYLQHKREFMANMNASEQADAARVAGDSEAMANARDIYGANTGDYATAGAYAYGAKGAKGGAKGAKGAKGGKAGAKDAGKAHDTIQALYGYLARSAAAPQFNYAKAMGDISQFSPEEIAAGKATGQQYIADFGKQAGAYAKQQQAITIRLQSQDRAHATMLGG